MVNNTLAEVVSALKNANTVAIACHARPDGDALGSGLALCLALKNAGKRAYMLCEEATPERLNIFPSTGKTFQTLPVELKDIDLFVCVDSAEVARVGTFAAQFAAFKGKTLNIDHHLSNPKYAKINYVFPDSTATCEIMPEILTAAGFEITKEIADLLAMGLLTDSGNFSHRDVTEKTFAVASKLKACGADFCDIGYQMFTRQSRARAMLYVRVLQSLKFELDGKLAFITVSLNDFEETGTDKSQTEGFVDYALSIDGVEVSVVLMEVKKNQYKISLRSKRTDVNAVAARFGGGGHALASGCMILAEYEEVIERLTHAVNQQL
ncbi:MAG: bifunctional oligoribonuclease/PAP phosphatase NrnA [Clostridia bacterium]|nr:bifunctional oligoribonuclease/PAP phosphatase NrnA [Clostridia bacterium]